jgi:hypothetical protein
MTTYTNPYTGQTISPSQVGYEQLTISTDTLLQWPINGNTDSVVANIIEITATVASLKVYMPPATQVSVGQSTLIRNIGSNAFTVVDQSGNTIVSVASGIAQYIYVTDNTTVNGTWDTVTFGAGTSSANAATLAGFGLKAISTTLNTQTPVTTFSANYLMTSNAQSSLYVWTGGAGTVTFPSASSVGSGWYVVLKNDGTGILNVALTGSDTIDGQTSAQLQIAESFVVVSNGSNWYSYAYGQSAQFFFTQLVKTVTGGTVTLTSAEGGSIIQEYQGVLTSNCTVILPSTVQLYSLQNKTTGAFTLTFRTSTLGAATVVLGQNQTIIVICDGTNVYNAQTATSSTITALTLGNGSAAAPSLSFSGDATTGLYLAASHQTRVCCQRKQCGYAYTKRPALACGYQCWSVLMTAKVVTLQVGPGIQRDSTQFASVSYVDGKWVRFQYARPRKIGGYNGAFLDATGISRGMIMSSENGLNYVVSGYSNGLEQWTTDNDDAVGFGPVGIEPVGVVTTIGITNPAQAT